MIDPGFADRDGQAIDVKFLFLLNMRQHGGYKVMSSRLLLLLLAFLPALALGEGGNIPDRFTILPDPEFRSLDEKVQSLRKDVLDLSKDLASLQKELLTPASTKVSVFVSIEGQDALNLGSMQLQLDKRPVANYLYSSGEQEALHRGGVQRLYLGNVTIGPHHLTASFSGKDAAGNEKHGTVDSDFEKTVAAKFFELKISKGEAGTPQLTVKEWE